jgi:hypothetical protein
MFTPTEEVTDWDIPHCLKLWLGLPKLWSTLILAAPDKLYEGVSPVNFKMNVLWIVFEILTVMST